MEQKTCWPNLKTILGFSIHITSSLACRAQDFGSLRKWCLSNCKHHGTVHALTVNCEQQQKIWRSTARWLDRAKLNRHTGMILSYWQKDLANSVQSLNPTTITLDKITSSYITVLPRYLFKKSLSNMGFLFEIISVSFKAASSKSLQFSSWKTARVVIWWKLFLLHCAVKTRAWQGQYLLIYNFYFLKKIVPLSFWSKKKIYKTLDILFCLTLSFSMLGL